MALIRLWKDGRLKELAPTMFASQDDFQSAVDFWYGEGWEDHPSPNPPGELECPKPASP